MSTLEHLTLFELSRGPPYLSPPRPYMYQYPFCSGAGTDSIYGIRPTAARVGARPARSSSSFLPSLGPVIDARVRVLIHPFHPRQFSSQSLDVGLEAPADRVEVNMHGCLVLLLMSSSIVAHTSQ